MRKEAMKILVTGANGQLGKSLQDASAQFPDLDLTFLGRDRLDVTDKESCFREITPEFDFLINTAAYTAVDAAEDNKKDASEVNSDGVYKLIKACELAKVRIIHISTDYVFSGDKASPYVETDQTGAITYYGKTKEQAEKEIFNHTKNGVIIRTSWMYSSYENNFLNTMLGLTNKMDSISVVGDQIGSPTSAHDLASFLLTIIPLLQFKEDEPSIYHFANSGVASWYDFAMAIMEMTDSNCVVHPITTEQYPTKAKRPPYSVLSTQKVQKNFLLLPPQHWRHALKTVIERVVVTR